MLSVSGAGYGLQAKRLAFRAVAYSRALQEMGVSCCNLKPSWIAAGARRSRQSDR